VPLVDLVLEDGEITALVSEETLRGLMDPAWYTRRADIIIERVFVNHS